MTSNIPITDAFFQEIEQSKEEQEKLQKLTESYLAQDIELTKEQEEFLNTKLSSKLWRINNLYTIRDKDSVKRILKLNKSQLRVVSNYKHNRKIILKSRQQGISTLFLAYYLDSCLFTPGFQAGIQSYGQDEADKLAKRALLMWDELDENVKIIMNLKLISSNQKGMTFSNGSVLKIGNFRGDTLQGLHVSELGKIAKRFPEKAKELKTGAFQAVGKNNKITVESTAEGKSGLFYEMWTKAESKAKRGKLGPFDFQPIFLSWVDDPDCNISHEEDIPEHLEKYFTKIEKQLDITLADTQKWWYVAKYDELGNDIKQEYPTTPEEAFEQSIEGSYYKNEYENLKIIENAYNPELLVHSAQDLGMNDTYSIGFFQIWPDGTPRIIGEFMDSGHGLEYYRDIYLALEAKFGWKHSWEVYVPHDIKVKELIADKTRYDALKELGFKPILVKKHKVVDGIEATRQFLKEVEIDSSCEVVISAIQNYRKKYDAKFDVFLDSPVHDEYSHTADMLRYMAMGLKHRPIKNIYKIDIQPKTNRRLVSGFDV